MAFDIFVGSLVRYYTGDWETAAGRVCRRLGIPSRIIRPSGQAASEQGEKEIRKSVFAWRRALTNGLARHLQKPLTWKESKSSPWFTEQVDWTDVQALMTWAARQHRPNLPKLLDRVELWFPCTFDVVFEAEDVCGKRKRIASSVFLLREVQALLRARDRQAVRSHGPRHGIPAGGQRSRLTRARRAGAVLESMAALSMKHALPMALDY